MQLTYSAEWQDENANEATLAICGYHGRTLWVSREDAYRWIVLDADRAIVEMGREGDEGDARDAAEEAIRRHAARTNG
ncbi:hypothetical protein [Nocardia wallacei]|uniref:hypothetical protein n=1 Tax=Nocardia wallacei TaxID=480035 RepID=UPI002454EF6C|nr:hypothetical protein [Nocardia wallacei]